MSEGVDGGCQGRVRGPCGLNLGSQFTKRVCSPCRGLEGELWDGSDF